MSLDRSDLVLPVDLGDLDACIRTVDAIVEARDWESLLWFADRCRAACETGHQLWPAGEYALARAALDAPGEFAGAVLFESVVEVGLGPRAEMAASTHTCAELAGTAPFGPVAMSALAERVVRGEDLSGLAPSALPGPVLTDLPRVLQPWEPPYALATYRSDRVEVPGPARPGDAVMERVAGRGRDPIDDDADLLAARDALAALTRGWVGETDLAVRCVVVEGTADDAIRTLVGAGPGTRAGSLVGADALALLAWAAASGGPHGRRRGAAVGRAAAWHLVELLAGLDTDGPTDADAVADALTELHWCWWDDGHARSEWSLGLAVHDPLDGVAWALDVR